MTQTAEHANDLERTEQLIRAIAAQVGPAVVGLGRGWGSGSGVVVAEGSVLTNAHAVRGGEATVSFQDGRREGARVAGTEPDRDLALVEVETAAITPVTWAPRDTVVELGSPVLALGDPGGRGLRVTLGFVSAARTSFRGLRGRRLEVGVEHTAPLPRGSSGAPLVDAAGRLVGLNALRLDGGLILAVAADEQLKQRFELIARGEAHPPRRLGLAVAAGPIARRMRRAVGLPDRDGVLVRQVQDRSPAAAAGLERGDLIVAAAGRELANPEQLHAALEQLAPGAALELRVVRGTDERDVAVSFDPTSEESP